MFECGLYLEGKAIGRAAWNTTAQGYDIYCSCPFEEGFIYRAQLCGENCTPLKLGVMLPKSGKFVLEKTISTAAVASFGDNLSGVKSCEILRTMPGEYRGGPLAFPLAQLLPYGAMAELDRLYPMLASCGALWHIHAGEIYVAAPIHENAPFALANIFCMTTPILINNVQFAIVKFDKDLLAKIVNIKDESGA